MTINEQIKILDNKIRSNQAQYDLDSLDIYALSSGELDKYEYLTGEDFGYKPDVVQKAKFEYSLLGQVFNKGLRADEKQERLLKRFKNIEGKTDNQLKAIECQKDEQLAIIKKSNQPRISDVDKKEMRSIKFDDPKLHDLREKIIEELMRKRKKTNTYHTTRKNKKGEKVRKSATDDFTDYAAIDLFAYIYTKKIPIKEATKEQ